jgi:hypothetical protein
MSTNRIADNMTGDELPGVCRYSDKSNQIKANQVLFRVGVVNRRKH